MKSLSDFLHMGGYAVYVWSSYALAAVVLGLNLWLPRQRRQQVLRNIARKQRRESL